MHGDHQVFVYAGATTTWSADCRYSKQANACRDFHSAARYFLTESHVRPSTPVRQILKSPVTPSTGTTDRSDLVPDSQHVPQIECWPSASSIETVNKVPDQNINDLAASSKEILNATLDLQTLYEISLQHFVEFENSFNQWRCTETPDSDCTHGSATSNKSLINLLDVTMSEYIPTPAPATEVHAVRNTTAVADSSAHEPSLIQVSSAHAGASPNILNCARDALLHRARIAVARRSAGYAGISPLVPHNGILNSSTKVMQSKFGPRITTNQPSTVGASSPSVVPVDQYITIATDSVHGPSRTPTSDERTTEPSNQTDDIPFEEDILAEISTHTDTANSTLCSMDMAQSDSHKEEVVVTHNKENSLILAQSNSPFYVSTFDKYKVTPQKRKLAQEQKKAHVDGHDICSQTFEHGCGKLLCMVCRCDPECCTASHKRKAATTQKSWTKAAQQFPYFDRVQATPMDKQGGHRRPLDVVDPREKVLTTPLAPVNVSDLNKDDFAAYIPAAYASGDEVFCLQPGEVDSNPDMHSSFLQTLQVPRKVKFQRQLRDLERGYWFLDLCRLNLTSREAGKIWKELVAVIVSKDLRWLSLQFAANTIRVYCYGHCVLQVWTLIYATTRKAKRGIAWIDAAGLPVLSF